MLDNTAAVDPRVECLSGPRCEFGESPFFDSRDGSVVYVDTTGTIIQRRPSGETTSWPVGESISFAIPAASGGYVVGLARGLCRFDPAEGSISPMNLASAGGPRCNDATVDSMGRVIFGTKATGREAFDGEMVVVDGAGQRIVARGFGLVNGLAVDAEAGLLFVADTHPEVQSVWRYRYDSSTGTLGDREKIFDFHSRRGRPDGATVDASGNLWIAEIGGHALVCLSANGVVIREIALPISMPTKPCFDGGSRMLVTTASLGVDLKVEPAAGHLLATEVPGASFTAIAAV